MDPKDLTISALEFDIVRKAYRALFSDAPFEEAEARHHARALVLDLTDLVEVDDDLISRIIRW